MANHIGKCRDCNTVAYVQNSLHSSQEKSEKEGKEGLHYKTVAVFVVVVFFFGGHTAHGLQLSVNVGHSLTFCFRPHSRRFP